MIRFAVALSMSVAIPVSPGPHLGEPHPRARRLGGRLPRAARWRGVGRTGCLLGVLLALASRPASSQPAAGAPGVPGVAGAGGTGRIPQASLQSTVDARAASPRAPFAPTVTPALPTAAASTHRALRYGPLVFGSSDRAALERFFDEPLPCVDAPLLPSAPLASVPGASAGATGRLAAFSGIAPRSLLSCGPARPTGGARPEVLLVDGTLRSLRFLLPPLAVVPTAMSVAQSLCGGTPIVRTGRGAQADLRLWYYPGATPADSVRCIVSEVRHLRTREVRLRLSLIDLHGNWLPFVDRRARAGALSPAVLSR